MRIACQQPNYFPWLGYFDLLTRVDHFVFLDDVQWTKQGRQHRTLLPSAKGSRWLTIPVHSRGHRAKAFREMEIDSGRAWTREHWSLLQATYGKEKYFSTQLEPLVRPALEKMAQEKFLLDACQESLFCLWDFFSVQAELHWSSDHPSSLHKTERLVELCQALGASEYHSALGSTRYLDLSLFRASGLEVRWQHFRPSFPANPLRPLGFSVLDWLAQVERSQIPLPAKQKLLQSANAPDVTRRSEPEAGI